MGRATASQAESDTDALEELRFHWGSAYHLAVIDGVCTAWRKDGKGGKLAAPLPGSYGLGGLMDQLDECYPPDGTAV